MVLCAQLHVCGLAREALGEQERALRHPVGAAQCRGVHCAKCMQRRRRRRRRKCGALADRVARLQSRVALHRVFDEARAPVLLPGAGAGPPYRRAVALARAVRRFEVVDEHFALATDEAVVDVRPALLVARAWWRRRRRWCHPRFAALADRGVVPFHERCVALHRVIGEARVVVFGHPSAGAGPVDRRAVALAGAIRRFRVIDEHSARPAYEAVGDVRPALLVAWAWCAASRVRGGLEHARFRAQDRKVKLTWQ